MVSSLVSELSSINLRRLMVTPVLPSKAQAHDNSLVKRLKMYVDGKPHGVISLKDAFNYQTVEVGSVELKPKKKTTLRFEILEVYKGRKYSDTAITEIELEGCCTH